MIDSSDPALLLGPLHLLLRHLQVSAIFSSSFFFGGKMSIMFLNSFLTVLVYCKVKTFLVAASPGDRHGRSRYIIFCLMIRSTYFRPFVIKANAALLLSHLPSGMSEPGGEMGRGTRPPQILADQLTLSQPGGQILSSTLLLAHGPPQKNKF